MVIEIADTIFEKTAMSKAEIKIEIAVSLYERNILTLEQASKLAEKDQLSFQKILAANKIPLHYGIDDFKSDLEVLNKMGRI